MWVFCFSVSKWTALLMIKSLNLTPLRTIRVVGWTNEENGGKGAEQCLF